MIRTAVDRLTGFQTLNILKKSEDDSHQKILRAVYGVVFFGVPHDGMDIKGLVSMGGANNLELISSLSSVNSKVLYDLRSEFHEALGKKGNAEVFCFYETEVSPTAQQVCQFRNATLIAELTKGSAGSQWQMELNRPQSGAC